MTSRMLRQECHDICDLDASGSRPTAARREGGAHVGVAVALRRRVGPHARRNGGGGGLHLAVAQSRSLMADTPSTSAAGAPCME